MCYAGPAAAAADAAAAYSAAAAALAQAGAVRIIIGNLMIPQAPGEKGEGRILLFSTGGLPKMEEDQEEEELEVGFMGMVTLPG
jgi:IMP dehydrogenase/GMP reductase